MKIGNKGQSLVEALLSFPLLISIFSAFLYLFLLMALHLFIFKISQSYLICRFEDQPEHKCLTSSRKQLGVLLPGVKLHQSLLENTPEKKTVETNMRYKNILILKKTYQLKFQSILSFGGVI